MNAKIEFFGLSFFSTLSLSLLLFLSVSSSDTHKYEYWHTHARMHIASVYFNRSLQLWVDPGRWTFPPHNGPVGKAKAATCVYEYTRVSVCHCKHKRMSGHLIGSQIKGEWEGKVEIAFEEGENWGPLRSH